MTTFPLRAVLTTVLIIAIPACSVGPDYQRPSAVVPASYKEANGWKVAQPADGIDRGAWWSIYSDPVLDGLERQIDISNQTLKASEAAYRQALAIVQEGRSGYLPTLTLAPSAQLTKSGSVGPNASAHGEYSVQAALDWDLDIWGRIRRTVESDVANAQASAADLATARLSAQAALAVDYFELRAADEDKRLFDTTIADFTRSLEIVRNQYAAGVAAKSDVAAAETQLQQAQAQGIDIGVQRATLEHAIAVLIGKAPADLSLSSGAFAQETPVVPTGLPSVLLQRRPDIAEAERKMAAANAQIGVAEAAFFPDITLSAILSYGSTAMGQLFTASSQTWSLGAGLAETVFDGGLRSAQVAAARATYDQSVANYRQTVLSGFQQVEDQLSTLRILEQEAVVQDAAVQSSHEATQLALNEYEAGITAYTAVITAQTAELSNRRSALTIHQQRMVASVTLIEALGGGWDAANLPKRDKIAVAAPQ
ncbi:MAG TPA: efflux transporter outer membrane subunit [Dongiaceae bacterium]|nr:efflux transporter outer membrane subunit [Dongiaceae bacterium]